VTPKPDDEAARFPLGESGDGAFGRSWDDEAYANFRMREQPTDEGDVIESSAEITSPFAGGRRETPAPKTRRQAPRPAEDSESGEIKSPLQKRRTAPKLEVDDDDDYFASEEGPVFVDSDMGSVDDDESMLATIPDSDEDVVFPDSGEGWVPPSAPAPPQPPRRAQGERPPTRSAPRPPAAQQRPPGGQQRPPGGQQRPGTGKFPRPPGSQGRPGTGKFPRPPGSQGRPGTGQFPRPPGSQGRPGTGKFPRPGAGKERTLPPSYPTAGGGKERTLPPNYPAPGSTKKETVAPGYTLGPGKSQADREREVLGKLSPIREASSSSRETFDPIAEIKTDASSGTYEIRQRGDDFDVISGVGKVEAPRQIATPSEIEALLTLDDLPYPSVSHRLHDLEHFLCGDTESRDGLAIDSRAGEPGARGDLRRPVSPAVAHGSVIGDRLMNWRVWR